MKSKWKLLAVAAAVAVVGIYYYISLPAINIHSSDTWFFIFVVLIAAALVYMSKKKMRSFREAKENRGLRAIGTVIVALGLFYLAGSLLSSPIINAKKYQKLMKVDEGEFTEDIEELSFDKIPLLDRDTAVILGDRKMGRHIDPDIGRDPLRLVRKPLNQACVPQRRHSHRIILVVDLGIDIIHLELGNHIHHAPIFRYA